MPIVTNKLGPGSLTLGAGALEVSAQLTGCKIDAAEKVETSDAVRVLSGEVLAAEDDITFDFALSGTFLQDVGAVASVVSWSWVNRGTPQIFTFVPSTADGIGVIGVLYPTPLTIGGDEVNPAKSNTADFTWRCQGTPDLDAV